MSGVLLFGALFLLFDHVALDLRSAAHVDVHAFFCISGLVSVFVLASEHCCTFSFFVALAMNGYHGIVFLSALIGWRVALWLIWLFNARP